MGWCPVFILRCAVSGGPALGAASFSYPHQPVFLLRHRTWREWRLAHSSPWTRNQFSGPRVERSIAAFFTRPNYAPGCIFSEIRYQYCSAVAYPPSDAHYIRAVTLLSYVARQPVPQGRGIIPLVVIIQQPLYFCRASCAGNEFG